MKKGISLLLSTLFVGLQSITATDVKFQVFGQQTDGHSIVTLGSESYLSTLRINSDGDYSFTEVPQGSYFIKIEASGYHLPNAQKVTVNSNGDVIPGTIFKLVITSAVGEED